VVYSLNTKVVGMLSQVFIVNAPLIWLVVSRI